MTEALKYLNLWSEEDHPARVRAAQSSTGAMDRRAFVIESLRMLAGLGLGSVVSIPWAHAHLASADSEILAAGLNRFFLGQASARLEHGSRPQGPSAAVIGGGVAGLAATGWLAQKGWNVDVFEKDRSIGGFCDTRVIDGFTFDLGPHVFGRRILKLAPFKPGDLDPATFSESFLLKGQILDFPLDFLYQGYLTDIIATIATNTLSRHEIDPTNMEELSTASYGPAINQAIFRPLIEKWCQTAMNRLDGRYLASRLHSKLEMGAVTGYMGRIAGAVMKRLSPGDRASQRTASPEQPPESGGIPPAPGYAGSIGARIVPNRLAGAVRLPAIHTDLPVTRIGMQKNRIMWIEAGGREIRPDYVISTIPLNRLAAMMVGSNRLKGLQALGYLNILFIFARISRPRLLKTEWTWIPDPSIPFYRMSEMKVLNPDHAPADATGLCLEVSFLPNDRRGNAPDDFWKKQAETFLSRTFGIKTTEIIGITVERRADAYPNFDKKNTGLIARYLSRPYKPRQISHAFDLGIVNLALAGRPGTFVYLLTPEAIRSGLSAARQAERYAGGSANRAWDDADSPHRVGWQSGVESVLGV